MGRSCGGVDREQARHALDHDAAHLADGLADQRDAVRAAVGEVLGGERLRAHPFGAGARLAGAAAAEHEPGVPGLAAWPSARARAGRRGRRSASRGRCASHSSRVMCAATAAAASGWRDKLLKALRNLSAEGVRLGCAGFGACGSCPSVGSSVEFRVQLRRLLEGLHGVGDLAQLVLAGGGESRRPSAWPASWLASAACSCGAPSSRGRDPTGRKGGASGRGGCPPCRPAGRRLGLGPGAAGRAGRRRPALIAGAVGDGAGADAKSAGDGGEGGALAAQPARLPPTARA